MLQNYNLTCLCTLKYCLEAIFASAALMVRLPASFSADRHDVHPAHPALFLHA